MANPIGSAARNASIMGQGKAQPGGSVLIQGTAVPQVQTQDPKAVAFGAWIVKAHPELSGLGGGARRAKMMPQLMAEFEPIWVEMQRKAQPAPATEPGTLGGLIAGGQ